MLRLIGGGAAARGRRPRTATCRSRSLTSETDLPHVTQAVKDHHRLDISVIGTGSSALSGPDGARFAYPARLEEALKRTIAGRRGQGHRPCSVARRPRPRWSPGLEKILADDKPALVIWQAGTADALSGIEPEDFRASLDDGLETIQAAGADVILMNMQYSPRTESMLDVSAYADVMRWVAQQRGACCSTGSESCITGTTPEPSTSMPPPRI